MIPISDDNPTLTRPVMTIGLILANILVFIYQLKLGPRVEEAFVWRMGAIPYELTHFRDAISPTPFPLYLTPITAMFIHGGWLHIGGNMLYLWIFGNNIEDIVGHFRFVVFYILCGLIATLAHVLSSPNSQIPMVGASGAIAGVLGAYFVSFPGARVRVLIPILIFFYSVRIPAIIVLGFWFLIQILNASAVPGQIGGVAWFAHIGGFIAGMVLVKIYRRRRYSTRYT